MKSPKFTLTKLALLCLPATLLVSASATAQQHLDQASAYASPVAATVKAGNVSTDDRKRYIVKYKQQQLETTGPGMFSSNALERRRVNLEQRQQRLAQRGARVKELLAAQSALAAELSATELAELQNDSAVEFIEEDFKRYPMAQQIPYGFVMVQADQVSDQFASNQKVCIIDSGLDLPHEDFLSGNITGTNNSGTGNWYDNGGPHGTHVAGTIAALNNATGMVGVLPNGNIKLHIVKVFNEAGWGYSSTLASAVNTCVSNGSTVINMSLGGAGSSTTESNAMQAAFDQGVLLIAAAGNDGNTAMSYPASYNAVVSVAAIDKNKQLADFSQRNSQVELAAPGVDIRSAYPEGTGLEAVLSIGSTSYDSTPMTNSSDGSANAPLASCGLGETTCSNVANKICVIERGNVSFVQKVQSCQNGGGLAAIIYNNTTGDFGGTLGDNPGTSIPALAVTQAVGQALMAKLGQTANLSSGASNYGLMSGTSMASPHVAGVAALLWSHYPQCTNAQIRNVLALTAEDLGTAGRDTSYGYGLVRTKTAFDYIAQNGCDGSTGGGSQGTTLTESNISIARRKWRHYTVTVPTGMSSLNVAISGGSGDADLYVRRGAQPTTTTYDCRPYKTGNAESCSFTNPQAATWYISVYAYSAVSGLTLNASYQP
jgi:serine protease